MAFPPPTERQAQIIWLALTGLAMAVLVALVIALVWGLGQILNLLAPVLWPLAIGGVLAYLLDPVVDWFERKGVPRTRAILCVFALALMVLAGVASSVVPQMINEAGQLVQRIPIYAGEVQNRVEEWIAHPPEVVQKLLGSRLGVPVEAPNATVTNAAPSGATTNVVGVAATPSSVAFWASVLGSDALESASDWMARALRQIASWLAGQLKKVPYLIGLLAGLALIPVYAFYFLLKKQSIRSRWTDYLPVAKSHFKDELVFVLQAINGYLVVFFRGQVLVAICDGILYMIGYLIIGLPYAVLLGVTATFLTIVPFIGAIITFVLAMMIAIVQFGDWTHPLLVITVSAVVQSLESLVISPKIMGNRVGLHAITIIVAVLVGTTLLGGLLGGILAIPLTATLRVVMFRYVWKKPGELRVDG